MSRLRLQSWSTNGKGHYTVNLDGVPLGCDGLFSDLALVIIVGQEVAKVPHRLRNDGAMPPHTEPSPYKPLNLKRPADYRPLVSRHLTLEELAAT